MPRDINDLYAHIMQLQDDLYAELHAEAAEECTCDRCTLIATIEQQVETLRLITKSMMALPLMPVASTYRR